MEKLFLVSLFLLLSCNITKAQNKVTAVAKDAVSQYIQKMDSLEKEVLILNQTYSAKTDSLSKELALTKEQYDYIVKLNTMTTDSISNQLSAIPTTISIFSILFGVVAIFLGVYVTRIESKVITLRDNTQQLLNQTNATRDQVVAINELIQNDITGLYEKIKREETVHILDRLVSVPQDICNLLESLLSRQLEKGDYRKLKEAYLKLDEKDRVDFTASFMGGTNYGNKYRLLFFQHFLDLLILDSDINKEVIRYYPKAIDCAFRNDILQSTRDMMSVIATRDLSLFKAEISSFMSGLSLSRHKEDKEVYELIFNALTEREKQFEFFNIIEKNDVVRFALVQYGALLKMHYAKANPSNSEKSVFTALEQIEEELNKKDETNSNSAAIAAIKSKTKRPSKNKSNE